MSQHRLSTNLIQIFLRVGVLVLLFPFIYSMFAEPGFEEPFWQGFTKIILGILYLGMAILFIFIDNKSFDIVGFSVALALSIFKMVTLFIEGGFSDYHALYFFIAAVSAYFINKARGKKKRRGDRPVF
ncbi:MAG: hypothetical protein K8R68_06000 [Bacteroidales bacterium]|nr:hypothetical protein [Bacteroidales bacterium]